MNKHEAFALFDHYLQQQISLAGAVLPTEKLAVLAQMEQALLQEGKIPTGFGSISTFNTNHPVYAAIIKGEQIAVSGGTPRRTKRNVSDLPLPAKIGVLVAVFVLPLLIVGGVMAMRGHDAVETEPVAAMATALPTPTATVTATPPAVVMTATPLPPTSTPQPIANKRGNVASNPHDPASIEIVGESFILSVGTLSNGIWQPTGAEWLTGTQVRRVVAVPFSAELLDKIAITTNRAIHLRLRSGEVVPYTIDTANRYRRDQIELLTSNAPSIAVVLYGEAGDERTVLLGTAVQTTDSDALAANAAQPLSEQQIQELIDAQDAIHSTD